MYGGAGAAAGAQSPAKIWRWGLKFSQQNLSKPRCVLLLRTIPVKIWQWDSNFSQQISPS